MKLTFILFWWKKIVKSEENEYEGDNPYHFFPTNQQKANSKIFPLKSHCE